MQQNFQGAYLGRIRVSGDEAETFLQGQLTQDVRALSADLPLFAGYCSAKGRLLAMLRLRRAEAGIELELHRSVLEATLKRLRMFVLRSKVVLDEVPPETPLDEASWKRQNILAGVPVVYAATSDHFVPQMVNLDQLGGISFSKGCYTGQEIVARLHYLGNLKRRMFLLRGAAPPPAPGTPVYQGTDPQAVGEVVDSADEAGGAVISAVLHLSSSLSGELRLFGVDGPLLTAPVAYAYSEQSGH